MPLPDKKSAPEKKSAARRAPARADHPFKGIALILNATLLGLLIAIPSLIFWSYYTKKVESIAVEMETLCDEFIRRQYREEIVKR